MEGLSPEETAIVEAVRTFVDRDVKLVARELEDSLRYAQERESFAMPIWKHQIGNYLADMATNLTAARQLMLYAARRIDAGERAGGPRLAWPSCSRRRR